VKEGRCKLMKNFFILILVTCFTSVLCAGEVNLLKNPGLDLLEDNPKQAEGVPARGVKQIAFFLEGKDNSGLISKCFRGKLFRVIQV